MRRLSLYISGLLILMVAAGFLAVRSSFSCSSPCKAGVKGLKTVKEIPLTGSANRFDYQSIDPYMRRLYISHMNSDMLTVFDLDHERVLKDIKDISRPTGVLCVPSLHKVFVSSSKGDEVVVIDENTLAITGRIKTGAFPDGIAFDPASKQIFVSNERGKQVTVIDAEAEKIIKNIHLDGEVGNTQYNPYTRLIYSAVQTKNKLVVIDPLKGGIKEEIPLKNCEGPHGFAIDSANNYAFITGEETGDFIVLDLNTKITIYEGKTGSDPDVLAYESALHKLVVASESGTVSIFGISKGKITKLSEGFLANHAHTVCIDPTTHKLYFPLENKGGKPVLQIMEFDK